MDNPITVLIVDDHEVVRRGVRSYLETMPEFQVVAEAESGEEAVSLVLEHIPDVVLMDLILPGMDGVETTRKIKGISPRSQIVVLTSYHDDEHVFPALKAGATAYILKDMKMDRLAEAVRKAALGEVTLHPRVAERVLRDIRKKTEQDQNSLRRPDRARDRSAQIDCHWPDEHSHCRGAGDQREHRERPREQHLEQAPFSRPHPGGGVRLAGRDCKKTRNVMEEGLLRILFIFNV